MIAVAVKAAAVSAGVVPLTEFIGNFIVVPQIHERLTNHVVGKAFVFALELGEILGGNDIVVNGNNYNAAVFHRLTVVINSRRRSIYRNAPKRIVGIGSVTVSVITESRINRSPHIVKLFRISGCIGVGAEIVDITVCRPQLELSVVYEHDVHFVIGRNGTAVFDTRNVGLFAVPHHSQKQSVIAGVFGIVKSINHAFVFFLLLFVAKTLHE